MTQRHVEQQEKAIRVSFGSTPISMRAARKMLQLPLVSTIADDHLGQFVKYVGSASEIKSNVKQLRENTSSTTAEPSSLKVLIDVVGAVESLQILEALYGYVSEKGCRIVGIANELTSEQRDSVWDINWEFQGKYPRIDIEIVLIQRRGRSVEELFNEGNSAVVKRVTISA